jgi:hypothetical protein
MLGVYTALIGLAVSIKTITILFGLFVAISMTAVLLRHRSNQRRYNDVALIGEDRHE